MQIIIPKCTWGQFPVWTDQQKIFQGEPNHNGGNAPHKMCSQNIWQFIYISRDLLLRGTWNISIITANIHFQCFSVPWKELREQQLIKNRESNLHVHQIPFPFHRQWCDFDSARTSLALFSTSWFSSENIFFPLKTWGSCESCVSVVQAKHNY